MPEDRSPSQILGQDGENANPLAGDLVGYTKNPAGTPETAVSYWSTIFGAGFAALFSSLSLGTPTELTIASGAVTATSSRHYIDTEGDAAGDDLETINGGSESKILVISPANASRVVVLKHGVDNILCVGDADITLSGVHSFAICIYDDSAGAWFALQGGGGGGGAIDELQVALIAQVFG
jgi:hypothetical protein